MSYKEAALMGCAGLPLNYYLVTFALWFGHWFSHLSWSPLRDFHVLGHHFLYPNSRHALSARFHYSHGKHNSNFAFLPWLSLVAVTEFLLLPPWQFMACIFIAVLIVSAHSFIHLQFHIADSPLLRFRWFQYARDTHFIHHDKDKNFMVADHFWDRAFRTYQKPLQCFPTREEERQKGEQK